MTVKQFSLILLSQWILWIVFTDNVGIREIVAGGIAPLIGVLAVLSFRRRLDDRYKLRSKHLLQSLHVPKTIAADTLILLRVIALNLFGRRAPGQIAAVHFRTGGDNSSSRGRRGLTITLLTLSPNTVVLGFLRDRQLLLFHELVPQRLPHFISELGASPDHRSGDQQ